MSETDPNWTAALEAFRSGHLESARKMLVLVLEAESKNVPALHLMSTIALRLGDVSGHVTLLSQILEVVPSHVQSLTALSNVRRLEGKLEEAIVLSRQATEVGPRYAPAHNSLGLCYEAIGEPASAAKCFETAIELQPEVAELYVNLGEALQHLHQFSRAGECFHRALKLAPGMPEAYEGLGHVYTHQRRRIDALRLFEKALELSPNSARRCLIVAEAKALNGFFDESLLLVKRAIELDPKSASAHLSYGFRMQELGMFEEAVRSFETSIEMAPRQGDAYLGLATSQKIREGETDFIGRIQSLLDENRVSRPDSILLHTALGKAYDDLGEYQRAIHHIDEANRIAIEDHRRIDIRGDTPIFNRDAFEAFVDASIDAFDREFVGNTSDDAIDSDLPIFIIGMPRSGTTLTEQILSNHPSVAGAGEQPFWTDVNATDSTVALATNIDRARVLGEAYLRVLREFGPSARFVTDKKPDNFLFLGLIQRTFPRARFIHCRRQPIDNCVSLYMTPFRVRPPFTHRREDILFYEHQYRRLMAHWREILAPSRILDVDYEHMVDAPEEVARQVVSFCGLEWDDRCLSPEGNQRSVNTPSNWQSRQPLYRSSVERWRNYEPWLGALEALLPMENR